MAKIKKIAHDGLFDKLEQQGESRPFFTKRGARKQQEMDQRLELFRKKQTKA